LQIVSTDEGIQIDRSDKQFSNANSPRVEIRHPPSNVNVERLRQLAKQHFAIPSIDEGIQIEWSDEQFSNADSPRLEIRQGDAKLTDRIEYSPLKHPAEIISIFPEMWT
jgi:hypothetical protein